MGFDGLSAMCSSPLLRFISDTILLRDQTIDIGKRSFLLALAVLVMLSTSPCQTKTICRLLYRPNDSLRQHYFLEAPSSKNRTMLLFLRVWEPSHFSKWRRNDAIELETDGESELAFSPKLQNNMVSFSSSKLKIEIKAAAQRKW